MVLQRICSRGPPQVREAIRRGEGLSKGGKVVRWTLRMRAAGLKGKHG